MIITDAIIAHDLLTEAGLAPDNAASAVRALWASGVNPVTGAEALIEAGRENDDVL